MLRTETRPQRVTAIDCSSRMDLKTNGLDKKIGKAETRMDAARRRLHKLKATSEIVVRRRTLAERSLDETAVPFLRNDTKNSPTTRK